MLLLSSLQAGVSARGTTGGGSIALRAWDLLGPALEAELRATARLDFTRDLRVVPAQLGDNAGLLGAGALAFASVITDPSNDS